MKKWEAYVNWNAGVCRVLEYPSQKLVSSADTFEAATTDARRAGYHVRVYGGEGSRILAPLTGSEP